MRIGYFVTKFPYKQQFESYLYGGSSLVAYYLAIEMKKRGHETYVFTTSAVSKDSIEKDGNITIYRYGTNFKILTSNISLGMFRKPVEHNVDVVHIHFDIPPGPMAGLRYVKKKKVPLIVTYHGDWEAGYGGLIRRIGVVFHNKYLVDKLLSYADVIISPSQYYIGRSRFLRRYKDKIVVIPNGINLDGFGTPYSKEEYKEKLRLPVDEKVILFVGNLSPYKGPDILVRAISKVIKHVPDAKLIFVGKGVMKKELEMLSKNLGIKENVRFTGFIDDNLKLFYYKAADVFCLPSMMRTECYPLVILEAMACNLPIVASNIGGIPDAVKNGENGLLVSPKDPEALSDAIIYLLENEEVRERMGRNGRKKVERYSWEKIAEETEKIYKGWV